MSETTPFLRPEDIDLRTVADHLAIRRLLELFCRGLDRADEPLIASVFHPDALDTHGWFQGTAADYISKLPEMLDNFEITTHSISNCIIERVSAELAHCESYCTAFHRFASAEERSALPPFMSLRTAGGGSLDGADMIVGMRYLDRFERRNGGPWLIAERRAVFEWGRIETSGQATFAEHPLHGLRSRDDLVYTSRAHALTAIASRRSK